MMGGLSAFLGFRGGFGLSRAVFHFFNRHRTTTGVDLSGIGLPLFLFSAYYPRMLPAARV